MIRPIVQKSAPEGPQAPAPPWPAPPVADPLSEVLALLKPRSLASGGFFIQGDAAISFPRHEGIKCYAMLAGECWLSVEGESPVHLRPGDCFLLPRGLPFLLTTDLALPPVHYTEALSRLGKYGNAGAELQQGARYMAGGFFALERGHAAMLLQALPAIIHLRSEADRAAMRWSLERMREELRDPQPGSALLTQQLASAMLVQALRLHLRDTATANPGWLRALADPPMSRALAAMHGAPGRAWTVASLAAEAGMSRSVFAQRFREIVGTAPLDYLTRWRMLLAADRLRSSAEGLATVARSLGYDSESAFGKAFRRTLGCSPRKYGRQAAQAG